MVDLKEYKGAIIAIIVIIAVLMVMIAVGFTIGILSEDPDGLESSLIGVRGEEWVENLPSPWDPILGWINNDYVAGIVGILLSVGLMMGIFYMIIILKKKLK